MSALDDAIVAIDQEIARLSEGHAPGATIGSALIQLSTTLKLARDDMDRQRLRHNLVLARIKLNAAFASDAVIQALSNLP